MHTLTPILSKQLWKCQLLGRRAYSLLTRVWPWLHERAALQRIVIYFALLLHSILYQSHFCKYIICIKLWILINWASIRGTHLLILYKKNKLSKLWLRAGWVKGVTVCSPSPPFPPPRPEERSACLLSHGLLHGDGDFRHSLLVAQCTALPVQQVEEDTNPEAKNIKYLLWWSIQGEFRHCRHRGIDSFPREIEKNQFQLGPRHKFKQSSRELQPPKSLPHCEAVRLQINPNIRRLGASDKALKLWRLF